MADGESAVTLIRARAAEGGQCRLMQLALASEKQQKMTWVSVGADGSASTRS